MESEDLRNPATLVQEVSLAEGYRKANPSEHYVTRGTVIPRAQKRVRSKSITKALPHLNTFKENIISEDEDGNTTVQRVDKTENPATSLAKPAAINTEPAAVEPPPLEALPESLEDSLETEAVAAGDLAISAPTPVSKPRPKTKVTFVGSFGKLTVPYDHVHREGIYLICTQHSETESFFEAPQSDLPLEVQLGTTTLMCYSGPQFRLSKAGKLFITVFLIDMEATEDRNRGY